MSAYGIGADTATVQDKTRKITADTNVPATIVKWIPGEAITFYAAILGIGSAQTALTGNETPQQILERIEAGSLGWFLTGIVIAGALVVTGALAAHSGAEEKIWVPALIVRVLLAFVAFFLWTSALPGSWTYGLSGVRDLGAAYALLLVPVGIVFAALAEGLTKRFVL